MSLVNQMDSNPETLEQYLVNGESTIFTHLLTAVSYEARGLTSLEDILESFSIQNVILFIFGTQYLDASLTKKWHEQREQSIELLKAKNINFFEIQCDPVRFGEVFNELKKVMSNSSPNIINITTFPKNYILRLAKEFDDPNNIFFYTRSAYRKPSDEELCICIENILPIEGFEGFRDISAEDLLVLILGYEGHRALSFLSKFSPYKILPLISIPNNGDDEEDRVFYKNVARCNWDLLRKHSVIRNSKNDLYTISSHSHVKCYNMLSLILTNELKDGHDLCISPLGTKPQALGLYLFWRENPETQLIFSIPVKRLDITQLNSDYDTVGSTTDQSHNQNWVYTLPRKVK